MTFFLGLMTLVWSLGWLYLIRRAYIRLRKEW